MSSKSVYPSPEQAIAAEVASKLAASRPTALTELESVKQELSQLREAVEGAVGNETVAVYDPHLADSIPAWVVENIQAVNAYMRYRGHEDWTIAGARSQAAHAREVERAVANERVRYVHTCHGQCERPLCAMTRRAEAAEGAMRTVASTAEGRMAIAKAIHLELDKVDEWLDAAMLAEREATP